MQDMGDPTAWSSLLLGLAALAAGAGALRKPGMWQTMIGEVEGSPALTFLSGMLEQPMDTWRSAHLFAQISGRADDGRGFGHSVRL